MAAASATREGQLAWDGHTTWFQVVGDVEHGPPPLVVCPGGPGTPHDYLASIGALARTGRACVFYDPIGGNGRSSQHTGAPASFWTVELFLDELDQLIAHVSGAGRYHLLGHTWGAMLALEHAVRRATAARSLVLVSPPASIALWQEEAERLTAEIGAEPGAPPPSDRAGVAAVYYRRHVCRLDPVPVEVRRSLAMRANDPAVYEAMIGAGITTPTGSLRDWDIRSRLGAIGLPALVVSGRYDETTSKVVGPVADGIPSARWIVFERSSHMPHVEEPDAFLAAVTSFLAAADS